MDRLFTRIFISTTAGVKCCVFAPTSSRVLLYFSLSFGITDSITVSILELSSAQAGAKGEVSDVANWLNKTGSWIFILYFGLVALEGSTFYKNLCNIQKSIFLFNVLHAFVPTCTPSFNGCCTHALVIHVHPLCNLKSRIFLTEYVTKFKAKNFVLLKFKAKYVV